MRVRFHCVARDWTGKFLGAKCTFQRIMVEPKMAEAISALFMHAVQFGIATGFSDLIFEGDTLQLIQDINTVSHFIILLALCGQNIAHAEFFQLFQVCSLQKGANGVAQSLAKEEARLLLF
jgi:hypothetical protein